MPRNMREAEELLQIKELNQQQNAMHDTRMNPGQGRWGDVLRTLGEENIWTWDVGR